MITTRATDQDGNPIASGAVFLLYVSKSGAPITQPTLNYVGDGRWGFTPSVSDKNSGAIAVLDFGASALPRYAMREIYRADNSNQFGAIMLFDGSGAFWAGAPATVLIDSAVRPSSVVNSFLFQFTPTASDVSSDLSFRMIAPVGADPAWVDFDLEEVVQSSAPIPGPPSFDNWSNFENALRQWIISSTALTSNRVYFSNQGVILDDQPRAIISIRTFETIGQDSQSHEFDPDGSDGEEIIYTACGMRSLSVDVTFFSSRTTGGITGFSLATRAQLGLSVSSIRDALNVAGLGLQARGTVQRVPVVNGMAWEDRAILSLSFNVPVSISTRGTFIETVEVDGTVRSEIEILP